MKRIIKILTAVGLLVGLAFLLCFAENRYRQSVIEEVVIDLKVPGPDTVILHDEVLEYITAHSDSILGSPVSDVNVEKIEALVKEFRWLQEVDASVTITGKLRVTALQRLPVMKVIPEKGKPFYIDDEGGLLKPKVFFPVYVPAVSIKGEFPGPDELPMRLSDLENRELDESFKLVMNIRKNDFINALTDQLIVNEKNEFELITKIKGPLIILGNTERLEEKFEYILHVYKIILPAKGWDHYKTINLKYANQVVCAR
jgi:cell division protein FtsQ